MEDNLESDTFRQVEEHLKSTEQNWLMGAGISYDAKLPLMYPLTHKVIQEVSKANADLYTKIIEPLKNELPNSCHIEHILSHLGDYAALAERNQNKQASINGIVIELEELSKAHLAVLTAISNTIRAGYYVNGDEIEEGTIQNPIVCVKTHVSFIDTLFNHSLAGISERRKPVNIFTTNYDTLLEDALSLNRVSYWDGFTGGAVAFRSLSYGDEIPSSGFRANIVKLHGSIDWYLCEKGNVWRVRENDTYPSKEDRVLIYPQATKYIATQQDPFSTQFDLLRKALHSATSNVLVVCGYSFGDEHINNEIEFAMSKESNKTVLVAFVECNDAVPECLEKWRKYKFSKRIFILSSKGVYVGDKGPFSRNGEYDDCWTFAGMTSVLKNGFEV
jgi:hypothetical protein